MYQLGATNYAADFFREQEDLKNSRTNRAIAEAQELRAQSLFSRQQEVQTITDNTLKRLSDIGSGSYNTSNQAVEALAQDALDGGPTKALPGFNNNPVKQSQLGDGDIFSQVVIDEKPRSIKLEPLDMSLGKMADAVGDALMRAGYGAEGMAYTKEGMEYISQMAEAEEKRAAEAIKQSKDFIEIANFVNEGLADVRSQEQQDAFLNSLPSSMIQALGPENVEQMRKIPYSPEVIQHYRDRALSIKETHELNMKAEDQQMRADRDAAVAFDRAARTRIAEQRRRDQIFIAENKGKASGKNAVITASGPEISQAQTRIVNDVFKGALPKKDSPDYIMLADAAQTIAAEAKQMAVDNPGLTYDQALTRSVTLHRGDFINPEVPVDRYKTFLGVEVPGTRTRGTKPGPTQFKPLGSSKQRPIVLRDRESAGKMVPGKWYTYNGRTMQYNP